MNTFAKVIRGLGWLWITLAALLNIAIHVTMLLKQGFWALSEALSPYNFRHFLTVMVTFAPGFVLLLLGDAIKQRQGKRALVAALVGLPVTLGLVGLFGIAAMSMRADKSASDKRTTEYKATSVRVLKGSAVMNEHRNYGITMTSGAVGSDGIPEVIKLGDVVTVKGRTIRVQHIFVTEIHEDMKWSGKMLAKKGDVHCVAVESEENLPYGDEWRNRLWINILECEPLARL